MTNGRLEMDHSAPQVSSDGRLELPQPRKKKILGKKKLRQTVVIAAMGIHHNHKASSHIGFKTRSDRRPSDAVGYKTRSDRRPSDAVDQHQKEQSPFKLKLNAWLHKHYVHTMLNLLLIADLLLLAISMNVELHFKDSIIDGYKVKCFATAEKMPGSRMLGGGDNGDDGVCVVHGDESLHDIERLIIKVSVCILGIFLLDNLGLLFANGMAFVKNPFCLADLIVVIVSIYFELSHSGSDAWIGMLVIQRTWRFIRIGHGLYELGHEEHGASEHVEVEDKI